MRHELQERTRAAHASIERTIGFDPAVSSLDRYHAYLRRMHVFHREVEPLLVQARLPAALRMPERVKAAWLAEDLAYFRLAPLEAGVALPNGLDPDTAWGWAYVLEGSTLGARTLYGPVSERWSLDAGHGARYLHGYGDATGRRWRAFTRELDAAPARGARPEAVIVGAISAFGTLEELFRSP